jgi:hypothetical protein
MNYKATSYDIIEHRNIKHIYDIYGNIMYSEPSGPIAQSYMLSLQDEFGIEIKCEISKDYLEKIKNLI